MSRQHSILFGNGFNLLTSEELRWDNLLHKVFPNNFHDSKKYAKAGNRGTNDNTLMYESLLLDEYRHDCDSINKFEDSKKFNFATELNKFQPNDKTINILEKLANLPVRYYMTTNFDNTFDKVFSDNKAINFQNDNSEPLFSLHRRHTMYKNEKVKTLWYVHGEASFEKTIMFGYDQYCLSLGQIANYLNHGGNLSSGKKHVKEYENLLKHFKAKYHEWFPYMQWHLNHYKRNTSFINWVDLFFLTDVHIIAQGLAFSEIDIWWLLNKRARYIEAAKKSKYKYQITNNIYYYGQCSPAQKAMFEAFGVIIKNVSHVVNEKGKVQYYDYYNDLITVIEMNINDGE